MKAKNADTAPFTPFLLDAPPLPEKWIDTTVEMNTLLFLRVEDNYITKVLTQSEKERGQSSIV